MGHRNTWYASAIGEVWHAMRHRYEGNTLKGMRRSVSLPVKIDEGAPVRDNGRSVIVRLPSLTAIDLGFRMIREGRAAWREDVREGLADGPLYADKYSRLGMVRRFLAEYAEETGSQDDDLDSQVADLVADLLKIAADDDVDIDYVIDKAREYVTEEPDDES